MSQDYVTRLREQIYIVRCKRDVKVHVFSRAGWTKFNDRQVGTQAGYDDVIAHLARTHKTWRNSTLWKKKN